MGICGLKRLSNRSNNIAVRSIHRRILRSVVDPASMMYMSLNLISYNRLSTASNLYPMDLGSSGLPW
jgi:hypothetical protein